MHISKLFRAVAVVAVMSLPATVASASTTTPEGAAPPDDDTAPVEAVFEGQAIELDDDWGAARACVIAEDVTHCFRTERQMDRFLATQVPVNDESEEGADLVGAVSTTCWSSVRLYDGPAFTGTVLSTSIRWTYLNLGNYGFSNRTSSYRIGGCSVELYSGENGSGGVYPGGTWAWASSGWLWWGWSNSISSLYMF